MFSFIAGLILLFIFFSYSAMLTNKTSLKNNQIIEDLEDKLNEKEIKLYEELDKLKESLKAKPKRNCNSAKCK